MSKPTQPCTLPLELEIPAALALLRKRGYVRAANRLAKASANILNYNAAPTAPKGKRIKISRITTASGKHLKLTRGLSVDAERIEETR